MALQKSYVRRGLGSISASALALALVMASPAHAQSDAAALQGHVDGASAGATVTATDTYTGQKVTGTIDANGDYELLGLRPSTWRVEVPGKEAQTTTLFVGQTGVIDFFDASNQIVVSGRTLREVRTATVSTNVTPAQMENLPQNSRNFLSFASLAPGVSVSRGDNAQVSAGGTASQNSNVLLDGMSMKNAINHGGIFGQNFGLGNPFPQIAVQEYSIATQNFDAQNGQVGSALITAITKTGGDKFHGSAFLQWQPNSFIEQPYFDKLNHLPKPAYDRKQFGGDFGGPIIPGVLTFYIAGEGSIQKRPTSTGNVTVAVPQALAAAVNVPHKSDFKQGLYFGKLTYYAGDSDTVNLSAFIRRENNLADIDGNATDSHGRTILTHQDRYQFQWKHTAGDLINSLNISYDKSTQSTPSVGTGAELLLGNPQSVGNTGTDFSAAIQSGAHFFTQGDSSKAITIRDDVTLRKGDHTVKFGAQVSFLDLTRSVVDHFNGSYYFQNPCQATPVPCPTASFDFATATPYGARINLTPSATVNAKDTQIGLYLQDDWKPDDHWTLNFGLRWDLETNANNNNYVTPTAIATALRNYPGWTARGINAEDYISNGKNRKPQWDNFQPRVGFSYDVNGDRDFVIFGGLGRYVDRSLFIEGVIETLTNTNKVVDVRFCGQPGAGATCVTYSPAMRDPDTLRTAAAGLFSGGGSVFVLNNKSRLPYSDQLDIGVRKRFGDITASVTLAYVKSHNIFQFTRANFYPNGWYTRVFQYAAGHQGDPAFITGCTDGGDAWIQDNSPNSLPAGTPPGVCAATNAQLNGFSGKLNRGASDGKANYTALYLQLEKPFTDNTTWGFTSSLTISSARTNTAQELNSDEFWNGARQDAYGWTNVNGSESWHWNTAVTARAPWGITLSGVLDLSSGPHFGNIRAPWNSSLAAPDGACCYGNMAGPYSPKPFVGYKRFDLRVAKTFELPFGEGHELTVDFQAFNVFNWLNRNYSAWNAGAGDNPPLVSDGDGQIGSDGRRFQAGIKYKF